MFYLIGEKREARSVGSAGPCPITAPAFVEMLFLCGGTDPLRCFILPLCWYPSIVLASRADGDCFFEQLGWPGRSEEGASELSRDSNSN